MPANTNPIFILTPKIQWATLTTAHGTASVNHLGTGTLGTDAQIIFTAGVNGARVEEIRVQPLGTNPKTILRFFVNNSGNNTTQSNNSCILERPIDATTITETESLSVTTIMFSQGLVLPPNYRLLVSTSITLTDGLAVTALGGDY